MLMAAIKRFFRSLGQTADPFRKFDPEYFLPKEWKGKTVEQRAAQVIAASYQEGIRSVTNRRPELFHVIQTQSPNPAVSAR